MDVRRGIPRTLRTLRSPGRTRRSSRASRTAQRAVFATSSGGMAVSQSRTESAPCCHSSCRGRPGRRAGGSLRESPSDRARRGAWVGHRRRRGRTTGFRNVEDLADHLRDPRDRVSLAVDATFPAREPARQQAGPRRRRRGLCSRRCGSTVVAGFVDRGCADQIPLGAIARHAADAIVTNEYTEKSRSKLDSAPARRLLGDTGCQPRREQPEIPLLSKLRHRGKPGHRAGPRPVGVHGLVAEFDADGRAAASASMAAPVPSIRRRTLADVSPGTRPERLNDAANQGPERREVQDLVAGSVAGLGDSNGRTPLHMVRAPRPDVFAAAAPRVRALSKIAATRDRPGCRPSPNIQAGASPTWHHPWVLEGLHPRVPVDARDKDGATPLMAAADYGKPDAVTRLPPSARAVSVIQNVHRRGAQSRRPSKPRP